MAGITQNLNLNLRPPSPTHILRRKLPNLPNQLFKVDLTPSLPDGCPVTVSRWLEVPNNTTAFSGPSLPTSTKRPHPAAMWLPGEVHVWFEVVYGGGAASGKGGGLDIGALGFSMPLVRRCGGRWGGVGKCEEVWVLVGGRNSGKCEKVWKVWDAYGWQRQLWMGSGVRKQ